MINRLFIIFSLLASSVFSGEISVSISEELVNDYLRLIGIIRSQRKEWKQSPLDN